MVAFLIQVGIALTIWAISREVGKDYTRKDGKPPPQGLSFPRVDAGTPIPYIYGTVRVDSPILIWKGNEAHMDLTGIMYRRADMLFCLGTPSWDSPDPPYNAWRNQNPPKLLSMWLGDRRYTFSNGGIKHGEHQFARLEGVRGGGGNFDARIEFFDGRASQVITGATGINDAMALASAGVVFDPDLVPGYRHQMLVAIIMSPGAYGAIGGLGGTLGEALAVQTMSFEVQSLGPDPV